MKFIRKEMPKIAEMKCSCGDVFEVGVDWFRYKRLPVLAYFGFALEDMMKHAEGKHLTTKYYRFKGEKKWRHTNWLVYQLKELYYHLIYRTS
jgi:hypothetical protein